MYVLILIQFFILQAASASSWHTLSGNPPVFIARGGFSGLFPDSSGKAYELVNVTTSPAVTLWCDLQSTKEGVGICCPNLNLDNGSDVMDFYSSKKECLAVDFTWKKLSALLFRILKRTQLYSETQGTKTLETFLHYHRPLDKSGVFLAEHKGISVVDAVLDKLIRLTTQEGQTTSITILIQSTDKSVLMDFKEKKTMYHDELVYKVNENIHDVTDSAIKDIKIFAGSIFISKQSVFPYSGGLVRLKTETYVVPRLRSSGFSVFVETFSNEFVTQPYDFFSDPTVEIDFFVRGGYDIDGIITDFPATTARYKKSQCYREMGLFGTGELVSFANTELLSPSQAPNPSLVKSDVTEPPLREVTPTREGVKAIQVSFGVRTMVVLVNFFIIV